MGFDIENLQFAFDIDPLIGLQYQIAVRAEQIEISADQDIVRRLQAQFSVGFHEGYRTGDEEAKPSLPNQSMWLHELYCIDCSVCIRIGKVEHITMLLIVSDKPAKIVLKFCERHSFAEG